jgi:hypothetical protein
MERGMAIFYKKAFSTDDPEVQKLRKRAYGNYHKVMAGSYFHIRDYRRSFLHAGKSIWLRAGNLGHFLKFPIRRFRLRRDTDPTPVSNGK